MMNCHIYILFVFTTSLSIAELSAISNDIHDRVDSSILSSLIARLDSLEQQTSTLSQRCMELELRTEQLGSLLTEEAEVLSESSNKTKRQEERLTQIEKALMVAIPEKLQDAAADIKRRPVADIHNSFRQETLEEFLGNRAAELLAVLPHEASRNNVNMQSSTFDSVSIGTALTYLTDTNQKLLKKIEYLERDVQAGVRQKADEQDDLQIQMLEQLVQRVSEVEDIVTSDVGTRANIQAESRKSAFSVAARRSQIGKDGALTPVLFEHVFLNKGEDFNMSNSTFICEVPGYYFFTFTMRTYYGLTLAVNLVKNQDYVVASFSDEGDRNMMSSQSVMLQLVPGDVVYLALGPSEQYAYYSDQNNLSTFTGFLLYKKS